MQKLCEFLFSLQKCVVNSKAVASVTLATNSSLLCYGLLCREQYYCIHDFSKLGIVAGRIIILLDVMRCSFLFLLLSGMCVVPMNNISRVAIPTGV